MLMIFVSACTRTSDQLDSTEVAPTYSNPYVQVHLLDDGRYTELYTDAPTVGLALAQADIFTYLGDDVYPSLDSLLYPDLEIKIDRSRLVNVRLDGKVINARTHRHLVIDVLADVGVSLSGADFTLPDMNRSIPDNGIIDVVRVDEQVITEYGPIRFGSLLRGLSHLEIDTTSLDQTGVNGLQARRVRVTYENGIEVARNVENEWVYSSPRPRIIGYGTQINIRSIDTPVGVVQYWRKVPMYATSYSPARSGTRVTAPWYGLTRTGKVLKKGMVAVDPDVVPLGTPLYIPGYGLAIAEDSGSGVIGSMIDLGYEDSNYEPWSRQVIVYFRTPVPADDEITWVMP